MKIFPCLFSVGRNIVKEKKDKLIDAVRILEEQGDALNDGEKSRLFFKTVNQMYRKAHKPELGVFELTPLCNLDCKMCYVHLTTKQMQGKELLSGRQWISWMEQAVNLGMLHAQLTGGEAMMHPDFDEIYLYLYEKGIQTTVMTNGLLLTKERIKFFINHPPSSIQITMYGGTEEGYLRVTGHRCLAKVQSNVILAKAIGCRIVLSITPSKFLGKEDALAIQKFARDNEIHLIVNNDLNEPRGDTGRNLSQFDLKLTEYLKIHKALNTHREEPVPMESLPLPSTQGKPRQGILCSAGHAMFCIDWQGNMKGCFDLKEAYRLEENNFVSVWDKLGDIANSYPVPAECQNCAYQKVCNLCPAIHMQNAPKGHADPYICDRTRSLMAEGLISKSLLVDVPKQKSQFQRGEGK